MPSRFIEAMLVEIIVRSGIRRHYPMKASMSYRKFASPPQQSKVLSEEAIEHRMPEARSDDLGP